MLDRETRDKMCKRAFDAYQDAKKDLEKGNFERLEDWATEEIERAVKLLCDMTPCSSRGKTVEKLQAVLHERKEKDKKNHGIHITMICGQEFHIDTGQPQIREILLQGHKLTPFNWTPKNEDDVAEMLSVLLGGEWRWHTNQDEKTYLEDLEWFRKAQCYTFNIPKDPSHIVFVPYAWAQDRDFIEDYIGVYFREDVEMVNPLDISFRIDEKNHRRTCA